MKPKSQPLTRHDLLSIEMISQRPEHASGTIKIQMKARGWFLVMPQLFVMPYPLADYFSLQKTDPTGFNRQTALYAAEGLSELHHWFESPQSTPTKITTAQAMTGQYDPVANYQFIQYFRNNDQARKFDAACRNGMENQKGRHRLTGPAKLADLWGLGPLAGILYEFVSVVS
jgi:hypothetical protein